MHCSAWLFFLALIVAALASSEEPDCERSATESCSELENPVQISGKQATCLDVANSVDSDIICKEGTVKKDCPCTCNWVLKCIGDGSPQMPPVECFPANAQVLTPNGQVQMKDLSDSAQVQVMNSDGSVTWSPVQLWLHRESEQISQNFIKVTTQSGHNLTVTGGHLMMTVQCNGDWSTRDVKKAWNMKVGNCMVVETPTGFEASRIVDISKTTAQGLYTFTTSTGNVVVNGVVVSCYAVLEMQELAHIGFQAYYKIISWFQFLPSWVWKPGADATSPILDAFVDVIQSRYFY